jgi:hypothetical protein
MWLFRVDFPLQLWWLSSKIPGLKKQKPEDPEFDTSCGQYSKDPISKEEKKEGGLVSGGIDQVVEFFLESKVYGLKH